MCIGARVANAELHGFAARVIQDHKLELDPSNPKILPKVSVVARPTPSPKINFTKRT